ncbi:MAG: hypothetical protein JO325_24240 [Solirubrobacterales bacterium]|nr:hypothetical protein [Solirubrobacterales bacterium]
MRHIRGVPLFVAAGLALAVAGIGTAAASAAGPFTCSGQFKKPGVLKGTYPDGVVVKGVCAVKSGKAHVIGTLTVTKGSALAAAYGLHHSSLTVTGNVVVDKGAFAILGCKANPDGSGIPCIDDHAKVPKLRSHAVVTGNIIANGTIGVLIHNTTIGGNLKETGGGEALSCNVPTTGVFAAVKSPPYSDVEDSTIGKNVAISSLKSCWLGLARDKVGGSVTISNNTMADPDAIEILASHITKDLACTGNSHTTPTAPGAEPVWDSTETSMTPGVIYPRIAEPNTVGGTRSGQCTVSTPTTLGGASGPGAF